MRVRSVCARRMALNRRAKNHVCGDGGRIHIYAVRLSTGRGRTPDHALHQTGASLGTRARPFPFQTAPLGCDWPPKFYGPFSRNGCQAQAGPSAQLRWPAHDLAPDKKAACRPGARRGGRLWAGDIFPSIVTLPFASSAATLPLRLPPPFATSAACRYPLLLV